LRSAVDYYGRNNAGDVREDAMAAAELDAVIKYVDA